MTVLSPQEEAELDATIQRVVREHGHVSNLMQILALAPRGLAAFSDLSAYVRYGTHLTELQRLIAIMIAVRDVHYGWAQFVPLAQAAGVTDDQLQLLREGRTPRDFASTEHALCAYVFEITACRRVPPRIADEMRAHFSPRQIVDIALLTAQFLSFAHLAVGLDVPLEEAEVLQYAQDWQKQRAGG